MSTSIAGLVLNGGLRTNIINDNSLDVRIGYLVDGTGYTSGVFTVGVAYTFGMNLY